MYIGSFDFGQMLNQPGMPQNQVFGQPVQGGDALGSFMANLPQADLSSPSNNSQIDFMIKHLYILIMIFIEINMMI